MNYELKELLHSGSLYDTWKAIQPSLGREVVVLLRRDDASYAAWNRFVGVVRVLARLRHKNIPQVIDIFDDNDPPAVVFEKEVGVTVSELVRKNGPLPVAKTLKIAQQVVQLLDALYRDEHIIVRNLKPRAIRIDKRGGVLLTDFSIALIANSAEFGQDADEGSIFGTPSFTAPEQILPDVTVDSRADMYSLGSVLYFCVTGVIPFSHIEDPAEILKQQFSAQIPNPRDLNPTLPAPFCNFITRLMMKVPANRYPNWQLVADDVARLIDGRNLTYPIPPAARSTVVPLPPGSENDAPALGSPTSRKIRRKQLPKNEKASPIPAPLRSFLWLILIAWFVLLANFRLKNPEGGISIAKNEPTRIALTANVPGTQKSASQNESNDSATAKSQPKRPPTSASSSTREDLQFSGAVILSAEAQKAADALKAADIAAAKAALEASSASADAQALALLNAMPNPNRLVAKGFQARVNKQITINYMGKDRDVIICSVDGGTLHTDFLAEDGSTRPIDIQIAKLEFSERAKWLPKLTTPAENASACVAALRYRDSELFDRCIEQCGALAPILAAAKDF